MSTIVAPEQREFFKRWPLPWGAATKIAKATGYASSTISSWTTGHTRIPRAGVDYTLEALRQAGMSPDADAIEILRLSASDHTPKRLKPLPVEPVSEPIEVENFEQAEWLLRTMALTDFQRLQLVRVLLT